MDWTYHARPFYLLLKSDLSGDVNQCNYPAVLTHHPVCWQPVLFISWYHSRDEWVNNITTGIMPWEWEPYLFLLYAIILIHNSSVVFLQCVNWHICWPKCSHWVMNKLLAPCLFCQSFSLWSCVIQIDVCLGLAFQVLKMKIWVVHSICCIW